MREFNRESERGSAGFKLAVTLVIIGLVFNAGYNYIPIAYEGETIKQEMSTAVLKAVSLPGLNKTPADVVKDAVTRSVRANGGPADTLISVKAINGSVTAQVRYVKKVNLLPFGLYKYDYVFDETVTPGGFLTKGS